MRYEYRICILVSLLVGLVYSYQIYYPAEPYFDEVHYVAFVRNLIHEHTYTQHASVHPPLWHLLMTGAVLLFGDQPLAWRLVSLLSGLGGIFMIYLLAKKVTRDVTIALLSVFFLTFDCLSLTQARIAMMNSTLLLFGAIALFFFWNVMQAEGSGQRKDWIRAGLFLGMALATKLVAASMLIFFLILIVGKMRQSDGERTAMIKKIMIYLVILPALIFFAVHLFIPFLKDRSLKDIWNIQVFNFSYNLHDALEEKHPYSSKWWTWPLMLRPIWYYFETEYYDTPASTVYGIIGIGNPAVFWMIPFTMGYLLWDYWKNRSAVSGFVWAGFLTQWLFFSFGKRLTYFHYFYNAMPFVVMGLAVVVKKIWDTGRIGRTIAISYLICVAGLFVYWYPLLVGMPIRGAYYGQHVWFGSWI